MSIILALMIGWFILTIWFLITTRDEPRIKEMTIIARIKFFWSMLGRMYLYIGQDSYDFFAKKFRRTRRKMETFLDRRWTRKDAFYEDGVAKDEFDQSLETDGAALLDMSREEVLKYNLDLVRRRDKAHRRDMEKS